MSDVPETRNGPGWVVMTHPNLKDKDGNPAYAEVREDALEVAWKPEGWVAATRPAKATSSQKAGA